MKPLTRRERHRSHVKAPPVTWSETCGKFSYATSKLAKAQAVKQKRMSGEEISAYKCPHGCHAWHIGHVPGWRSQLNHGA